MLLVVNYHYFREPENSEFPGIHGVNAERFDKQIQHLSSNLKMLKPSELSQMNVADFEKENYCLITFDDGLKEQYEIAKPILDKYNVEGLYFINGINVRQKEVSLVHKIHWLRSVTPPNIFMEELYNVIESKGIEIPLKYEDFSPVEGQNIYDNNEVKYTKYLLNHVLSFEEQSAVLNEMYQKRGRSEQEHAEELYFNEAIIEELGKAQMIGSHGFYHDVKTNLSAEGLRKDLSDNQELVKELCGKAPDFVSYPYGGKTAVSEEVGETAKACGLKLGFTMERAINQGKEPEMLLTRLDANDVPFGKNPLVEINNGEITIKSDNCTLGTVWFQ